jgi:hypothetical protein
MMGTDNALCGRDQPHAHDGTWIFLSAYGSQVAIATPNRLHADFINRTFGSKNTEFLPRPRIPNLPSKMSLR